MKLSFSKIAVLLGLACALPAHAAINVSSGASFTVNGSATASTIQGASGSILTGNGTLAAATTVSGTLSPAGTNIGTLATNDLTIGSTGSIDLQVNAADIAGTDFDQVQVTGALTLQSGATLNLSGTGALSYGDSVVLISNDGADAISGTFSGLPEGAAISLPTSGTYAQISYTGGDGNDVALTITDSDGDGINDTYELAGKDANGYPTGFGPTDPNNTDTDADGTLDGAENSVLLPIASYSFNGPGPNGSYPDSSGSELIDGDRGSLVWPNSPDYLPLAGWANLNPDITFTFTSAQTVKSITVWAADSDHSAGVALPSSIAIYADGIYQGTFGVSNPTQTGSIVPLTISGLNLNATAIRVIPPRTNQWTMLSEVQFAGNAPIQTNSSIGTIAKPSGLTLTDTDRVLLRVDGTNTAGSDYDHIQVTGTVDLSTAALELFGTASGSRNFDEIILISNDGNDPVVGRFGGTLAEGATIYLPEGGDPLYISYQGGDGNDVTLRYADPDNDGLANDIDPDDDGDGISDLNELAGNDASGVATGFGPTNPLDDDSDRDGLNDLQEILGQDSSGASSGYGTTNPTLADTDSDGVSDGNELAGNNASGASSGFGATNPNNEHSDSDGISDGNELAGKDTSGTLSGFGPTNPNNNHSDSDGISDDNELAGNDASGSSTGYGATNPLLDDSDADGISDDNELAGNNDSGSSTGYGATDPTKLDTDGDGFADLVEINLGSDPNNGSSDPLDGGLVVSSAADENDGNYSAGNLSLREAIERMKSAGTSGFEHTITFDPALDGATITFDSNLDLGSVHPTLDLGNLPSGLTLTDSGFSLTGTGQLSLTGGNLTLITPLTIGQLNLPSGHTLTIGSGGTKGSVVGTLNSNGTTIINRSDTLNITNLVGTGTLLKQNTNNLYLNSAASFTGLIEVDTGTLTLLSAIGGNILNNGAVSFNIGGYNYPYAISGTGSVAINSGPVSFNQHQSYTGATTVTNATFIPFATMATSGIQMSGSSTLQYVYNNSVADYPITGSGTLENTAPLLINRSNTFSGTVNIKSTLTVSNESGSATGSANIVLYAYDSILKGSGSVSGTLSTGFNFTETIEPDNNGAPATLGIDSLVFVGNYNCDLNGSANDQLNIAGGINCGWTQLNISQLGQGATDPVYIIAKYGSISGTFHTVTGLPTGYSIDYAYNDGTSSNNIAIKRNLTTVETWALANGLSIGAAGNGDLGQDPNNDGKSNLYHFAFNTAPLGNGSDEAKLRSSIASTGGATKHLCFTIPVRDGAAFSGTGVDPTLTVDGIVYTIRGDDDLTPGSTQVIAEHTPALDAGMPALDTGYSYRTFYLQNAQTSMPKAFLSIQLTTP